MSRDIGGTPHEGFRYLSDCFPASTLCSLTRYLLLERFVRSCACRLYLMGQKLLYPVCRLTLLSSVLVVQRLASEASIDCGVNRPEVAQRNRICPSPALAKQIRGSTPTHSRTAIQSPRETYFPPSNDHHPHHPFPWTDFPSSLRSCAPPLFLAVHHPANDRCSATYIRCTRK